MNGQSAQKMVEGPRHEVRDNYCFTLQSADMLQYTPGYFEILTHTRYSDMTLGSMDHSSL